MINTNWSKTDIHDCEGDFQITEFYGQDALGCTKDKEFDEAIEKALFKEVVAHGETGIVVGFEINEVWHDYYFIVFIPKLNKSMHVLANDASFYRDNNL